MLATWGNMTGGSAVPHGAGPAPLPAPTMLSAGGTSIVAINVGLDPNGSPTNFTTTFGAGRGSGGGGFLTAIDNKVRAYMGYCAGITSSTSLRLADALSSTSTATTGNPANVSTGVGADVNYNAFTQGDAALTDAGSGNIIYLAPFENDGYSGATYYSSTNATQSMILGAQMVDALLAAGKVVFFSDGLPRGLATYYLESHAVASNQATATHGGDGHFVDGADFPTPIVGCCDQTGAAMTKVASGPAAGEYSVSSVGVYSFNAGAPPTTVYLTYSADNQQSSPNTSNRAGDLSGWVRSSAANYVGIVSGTNYARPGLLFGRHGVYAVNTWAAVSDGSSPGKYAAGMSTDGIHPSYLGATVIANAFASAFNTAYPSAVSKAQDVTTANQDIGRSGAGTKVFHSTTGTVIGNPVGGNMLPLTPGTLQITWGDGTADCHDTGVLVTGNKYRLAGTSIDPGADSNTMNVIDVVTGAWDFTTLVGVANLTHIFAYVSSDRNLIANPYFEDTSTWGAANGANGTKTAAISSTYGTTGNTCPNFTISTDSSSGDVTMEPSTDPISGKPAIKITLSGVTGSNVKLISSNNRQTAALTNGHWAVSRCNVTVAAGANGHLYGVYGAWMNTTITVGATTRNPNPPWAAVTTVGAKMSTGTNTAPMGDGVLAAGGGSLQLKHYSPNIDLTGYAGGASNPFIQIDYVSAKPKSAIIYVSGFGLWDSASAP